MPVGIVAHRVVVKATAGGHVMRRCHSKAFKSKEVTVKVGSIWATARWDTVVPVVARWAMVMEDRWFSRATVAARWAVVLAPAMGGNVPRTREDAGKSALKFLAESFMGEGKANFAALGQMAAGFGERVVAREEDEIRRPRQEQVRYVLSLLHPPITSFTRSHHHDHELLMP